MKASLALCLSVAFVFLSVWTIQGEAEDKPKCLKEVKANGEVREHCDAGQKCSKTVTDSQMKNECKKECKPPTCVFCNDETCKEPKVMKCNAGEGPKCKGDSLCENAPKLASHGCDGVCTKVVFDSKITFGCMFKSQCEALKGGEKGVCHFCNDKDNCNGAQKTGQGLGLVMMMAVAFGVLLFGM